MHFNLILQKEGVFSLNDLHIGFKLSYRTHQLSVKLYRALPPQDAVEGM
jgi:hypothetical protein